MYIGFTILDSRKYVMYDFHCNYIKRKYDANLLFTNTDSLVYEIETNMFIKVFIKIRISLILVFIQKLFDHVNEKFIGKMKDEFREKTISEFVGLKTKVYSLIDIDNGENKKTK